MIVEYETDVSNKNIVEQRKKLFDNFNELKNLQEKMLNKASNILNINGLIIYMVCSFLKYENEDQINSFLLNNNNFEILNFNLLDKSFSINCSKVIMVSGLYICLSISCCLYPEILDLISLVRIFFSQKDKSKYNLFMRCN